MEKNVSSFGALRDALRLGPRVLSLSLCLIAVVAGDGSAKSFSPVRSELPNLVPLRPFHVVVNLADDRSTEALRFSFAVANRGAWPLDLESRPAHADTARSEAWQCVSWITTRGCVARQHSGALRWHESHGHFHYGGFARYELRRVVDGGVDWSRSGLVTAQRKVSYCLTNGPRDRWSSADPLGPNPAYVCGNWIGLQGISPGYVDIYDWELPGQFLRISGLPNGRYALAVTVNPNGSLAERSRTDNKAVIGVTLRGATAGRRHVSTFRLGG